MPFGKMMPNSFAARPNVSRLSTLDKPSSARISFLESLFETTSRSNSSFHNIDFLFLGLMPVLGLVLWGGGREIPFASATASKRL